MTRTGHALAYAQGSATRARGMKKAPWTAAEYRQGQEQGGSQ